MTADLTTFLLERIAADEERARAAMAVQDPGDGRWWIDGPAATSGKWWAYAFQHEATAAHIAAHDPARVLAQCTALRAVVSQHETQPDGPASSADTRPRA